MTDRLEDVREMRRDDPIGYVRWLHVERPLPAVAGEPDESVCNDCREDWPCATYRALEALITERDGLRAAHAEKVRSYRKLKAERDRLREAGENLAGDVYLYSLAGDADGHEIAWSQVMESQGAMLRALSPPPSEQPGLVSPVTGNRLPNTKEKFA